MMTVVDGNMPHVFDYSTGRPNHATLVSVGALGVCRYLSKHGVDQSRWVFNDAKRIRPPEYESLEAHRIPITLNCQVDKADWQGGYSRGVEHGRMALAQCRELGHPLSRPVIFTVQDSGIPSSSLHLAVEYMHGCMDGNERGPQPLYGGTTVINACVEAGYATWGWLPEDATSWSPKPSPYIRLVQHGSKSYPQLGVPYDENTPLHEDWGQYPLPSIPPKEEIMAFLSKNVAGSPIVVAADCSSWFYASAELAGALTKAGYETVPMLQSDIDRIPYVHSLMHALTAAVLHAADNVDFTLTPEQIQVIADSVQIGDAQLAAIAKAVADEDHRRSSE